MPFKQEPEESVCPFVMILKHVVQMYALWKIHLH